MVSFRLALFVLLTSLSISAQSAIYLDLCNRGKLVLTYGSILEQDNGEYQLKWFDEIEPGKCAGVHGGERRRTLAFVIIDPSTGYAYNPVFKPNSSQGKNPIKELCVPSNGQRARRAISAKVLEKFKIRCPRNWVSVNTSFTTAFREGWNSSSTSTTTLTINISPTPKDFTRRVW